MFIALTAVLSALLTHLQISLNHRLGLNATPRSDRWHFRVTPSSGGLTIFLTCAAAWSLAYPGRYPRVVWAATILCVFGFLDDRLRFSPVAKLSFQIAAAAFVVFGSTVYPITPWYWPNVALNLFWIVMITNAFNLIDNMDGLCAGVVVIICLFRGSVLVSEDLYDEAGICAIIAAAFAGFLVFNYPPARIFMGDCGSLPVGFALGALTLAGPAPHPRLLLAAFFYPALTFAYPIFDTALVSILRKLAGQPISMGGLDHSSHRLASFGLNQHRVLWSLWLLTALGCSTGLLIRWIPQVLFIACTLLLGILLLIGLALARAPGFPALHGTLGGRA
jgi:UDP-GlcNAc:undecaprenyl-phosphate GlcNAc-1-phosphate transferase